MDVRKILGETQKTIENTAPEAEKTIGYGMQGHKMGKGAVQFPFDEPMPIDLISKVTRFRIRENLAKSAIKG